jgi:hypothetical protein
MVARVVVELRPMKTAAKILAGAVVLAALLWTTTFLYWHVRILGAIRTMDGHPTSHEQQTASDTLNEAGCRSLPYLFEALNPDRSPNLQIVATIHIGFIVAAPGEPILYNPKVADWLEKWQPRPEEPPDVRRRKFEALRLWWKENGPRYHQVWRVWSKECLP